MALVMDEQLATLLLAYYIQDTRVSWTEWGQLALVNKAFRDVFRAHSAQIVAYRLAHLQLRLNETQRQLHLWRSHCTCHCFWRSDDSDADDEVHFADGALSPATSVEY